MQKDRNTGWIKLHRDIKKHWVYDNAEYLKAWIHLLIMANHKTKTWLVEKDLVLIKRGQIITSLTKLSHDLKWSRTKVRHFLSLLEKDTMINRKSTHHYTQLSICNYDTYQDQAHTSGTTKRTPTGQPKDNQKTQLKNGKNEKNVKNEKELESRQTKFENSVMEKRNQYTKDMLTNFIQYWTEPNKSKTRMRFEMEKTWDTTRRLVTWEKRSKNSFNGQANVDRPKPPNMHYYICTECNTKKESPLPTWKVKCDNCSQNSLVLESELKYFR